MQRLKDLGPVSIKVQLISGIGRARPGMAVMLKSSVGTAYPKHTFQLGGPDSPLKRAKGEEEERERER